MNQDNMPISEDEFEYSGMQEAQSTMSKAELRKTHKPIMEKRRRARINLCLNEIKSLILEAMNKDPSRHTKLEKADILEMAVKHLQNVQRQQLALAMASDPSVLRKFKSGFNECATEIDRYIGRLEGPDTALKTNINAHLQSCISGIEQVAHLNFPGLGNAAAFLARPTAAAAALINLGRIDNAPGDQNNNPNMQMPQGLHVIPSRLPSGELALVLPNTAAASSYVSNALTNHQPNIDIINHNNNNNNNNNNSNSRQRPSAFAAVMPTSTHVSRPLSPPPSPPHPSEAFRRPHPPMHSPPRQNFKLPLSETDSPKAFKAVQPNVKIKPDVQPHSDHQVAHISSTSISQDKLLPDQMEVKPMRFPIHNLIEKKASSPKKLIEPLCIITNQSERYRQAQTREDSARFEENITHGVKRKFQEYQGLLAVASHEIPSSKVLKTHHGSSASSSWETVYDPPRHYVEEEASSSKSDVQRIESTRRVEVVQSDRQVASSSQSNEAFGDMWRPW